MGVRGYLPYPDHFVEAMVHRYRRRSMAGVYQVTSPNPIVNADMMATYNGQLLMADRPFGAGFGQAPGCPSCWGPILRSRSSVARSPARLLKDGSSFPSLPLGSGGEGPRYDGLRVCALRMASTAH